uniref:Uncharacterized protein n=1 Tax=Setaria italica TaxID=4555 RepID=K3XSP0_SETIT
MAYPHTVASKQTHSRQSARDIDNGGRYQQRTRSGEPLLGDEPGRKATPEIDGESAAPG